VLNLDFELAEDVLFVEDDVVDVVDLDVGAGVLGVEYAVADGKVEDDALAVVIEAAGMTRPLEVTSSCLRGMMTMRSDRGTSLVLLADLAAAFAAMW
jgi:hypothetical protein